MKQVKVKRIELLEKVTQNREKHLAEYDAAMLKYREIAIHKMDDMLRVAKAGGEIARSTELVEPRSMVSDYDRAISMLTMSVDDNIELSQGEFENYVLDNWQWTNIVKMANTAYLG